MYKGLQEQHCHIWHRHSCSWMTSRSLPALFLYLHHRWFDLELFSYNWVPTQILKMSQNPTEKGLPVFSRTKIPTTASTSSFHCCCLLSKRPHCLLSARRRIGIKCHHTKQSNSDSNTIPWVATFNSRWCCVPATQSHETLIYLT